MADQELFAMVAEGTLSQLSPEVGKKEYLADLFFLFFPFILKGFETMVRHQNKQWRYS